MYRMLLPKSIDGAELELATFFEVIRALAEGDASAAWCVVQSSGCSFAAAYLDPAAAREIFGGARDVLAWGFPGGPNCRAEPVDGGWKVNGMWNFGSGSRHATWLGGHCHVPGSERTMLFPRSCAQIKHDSWNVVGLRGTGSDSYSVTDLFVPAGQSVVARAAGRDIGGGEEPERRERGMLYRFTATNVFQTGFAAVSLGIARAMLDDFVQLAQKKAPAAGGGTMRDSHWIQSRVALAEAKLGSARAFILQTLGEMREECSAKGRIGIENRIRIRLASTYAISLAREVAETAYVDAGATAIFEGNRFERRFRDMHAATQQVQASAVHFQTAGQYYLGLEPNLRFV